MPVADRMTAREFLARPAALDARRRSLVEGEVVVNEPTWRHGVIQVRLLYALETWVRAGEGRGMASVPIDVLLDDRNVYAPDVLWYAEGRPPALGDPPPYGLPDLAIEIRSPTTWAYDVGAKKAAYERHGLSELWLVDSAASEVLAFRRSRRDAPTFDVGVELERGDVLESPLLSGFALAVADLFAEPGRA